jgi:hypothetical protein
VNVGIYKWSSLNRFASADTLVPDPTNPQSLNRLSYVGNQPLRYTDPSGYFCYDADDNEFSDGDCFDDQQQAILDYFIRMIQVGELTDLEMSKNLLDYSLLLIDDPVAALRTVSEIVRENAAAPGNWGWEYTNSRFFVLNEVDRLDIEWDFTDSGFGDLAEPDPNDANQMSHFIGIAYVSAYTTRGSTILDNTRSWLMVWGQDRFRGQPERRVDIEVDLGNIASEMGRDLVVNQAPLGPGLPWYAQPIRPEVANAINAIQSYDYASEHPFQNWLDTR